MAGNVHSQSINDKNTENRIRSRPRKRMRSNEIGDIGNQFPALGPLYLTSIEVVCEVLGKTYSSQYYNLSLVGCSIDVLW